MTVLRRTESQKKSCIGERRFPAGNRLPAIRPGVRGLSIFTIGLPRGQALNVAVPPKNGHTE